MSNKGEGAISRMAAVGTITTGKSLLSPAVLLLLEKGLKRGFEGGWLELNEKEIDDKMMPELCECIIKISGKIRKIQLAENKISSKGASMLFETLKASSSLITHLYLGGNQIGDDCMSALGEFLLDTKYLKLLHLGENIITDKGIETLSSYLIGNVTLKELYLMYNYEITDVSVPYLVDAIKSSHITKVYKDGITLSFEKQQELKKATAIPLDKRETPVISKSKSAAKISYPTKW